MPDYRRFLKENGWSLAMLVFTAVFYVSLMLPQWRAGHAVTPAAVKEAPAAAENKVSKESLRLREEKFKKTLEENPRLFGLLTLLFGGVLLAGISTDAFFAARTLHGKPLIEHGRSQEDVPWGLAAVFRVFVLIFFLEALILSLEMVASLFLDMRGVNRDLLLMINSLLRNVIAAAVIVALVVKRYRTPLERIGLTARDFGRNVRTGLIGYVAVVPPLLIVLFFMALIAKSVSYEPPPQPVVEMYIRESAPKFLLFFTVFVAVLGPLMEELFFRGFAYKALRTRFGVNAAMTATALFFALLHTSVVAFIPIFLLGFFLNYLYEKTGSLVPGMVAHMTHNLIMVCCTLAFKSLSG
jgi:membrane protease YdiL (CAAX protease family)